MMPVLLPVKSMVQPADRDSPDRKTARASRDARGKTEPNIQQALPALREPCVQVGGGLKLLDSFCKGIAFASARQLGGFGLEP